jgi:UDP-sulfoquinovose synthase
MRVLVCGMDGYLGHSLACHLMDRGHTVAGLDSLKRRVWVKEVGSDSAMPIASPVQRVETFLEIFGERFQRLSQMDMLDYAGLREMVQWFQPEAVVNFAHQPSAPFSMIDAQHAALTQQNNVIGNLNLLWVMREAAPEAHLVLLGTMGEYGTPDCPIPEGVFPDGSQWVTHEGTRTETWDISGMTFPRSAPSWYHQTKVFDTYNTMYACKVWHLRATDIMQGVVYGTHIDAFGKDMRLCTRFDQDQAFGTAINRFVAQAVVGHPLTVYGLGHQRRGFLPLRDSMQCLTLALENPPQAGEYRTFNQFEEVYSIGGLAKRVQAAGARAGLDPVIQCLHNPRLEASEHFYRPTHQHLLDLGYEPTHDMDSELDRMFSDLLPHAERIRAVLEPIHPVTHWSQAHHPAEVMAGVRI